MNCPRCPFAGTLQEVRAHVVVQARVDDDHAAWVTDHGIDLDDETQASVGELTHALSRSTRSESRVDDSENARR